MAMTLRETLANRRVGDGFWATFIGWLIGRVIGVGFRNFVRYFVGWLWLWALVAAGAFAAAGNPSALIVALVVLGGLIGAGFWKRGFWYVVPFYGDYLRNVGRDGKLAAFARGNGFFEHIGLIKPEETNGRERIYPVSLFEMTDRVRVVVNAPIPGLSTDKIVSRVKEFKSTFDAVEVDAIDLGKGALQIDLLTIDPLADAVVIDDAARFDSTSMTVDCAMDAKGNDYAISFKDLASVLISGQTGSGKTAGASSFLLPMAISEDVRLTIIDGKGGTDWGAYADVAADYVSVDGTEAAFKRALDLLNGARDEMRARIADNQEVLGESNFWNASVETRRAAKRPLNLIVIDEAQELFTSAKAFKTVRPEEASDAKAKPIGMDALFLEVVSVLTKVGRSSGTLVMLMTQKPTSDAIPTAITSQAGLRIAFRLDSSTTEASALGAAPEDDPATPRAFRIPLQHKGRAVIVEPTGGWVGVRFYYLPEQRQKTILAAASISNKGENDE